MKKFSWIIAVAAAATCSGISNAGALSANKPPKKGCKVLDSINAAEDFADGMHHVSIVNCGAGPAIFLSRTTHKDEKPDFLAPHYPDFPNEQKQTIIKRLQAVPPKGTTLRLEGSGNGLYCSDAPRKGDERLLLAIDLKSLKLKKFWIVDFKMNTLVEHDGQEILCKQVEED